jgi:hypothetical protein
MVYGWGCGIIESFNLLMTLVKIRFFWLPLSTMKCSGVPFTHICEWKRHSPSSSSSDSSGWIFVVVMVALGSTLMIHFPLSYSESESELGSDSFSLSSTNNDCFEWTFISVVPGDFVELTPFSSVLLHLPITLLFLWLGLVVLRLAFLSCPLFCELGPPFPCFCCCGFADLNSHLFHCLNFCLILTTYR